MSTLRYGNGIPSQERTRGAARLCAVVCAWGLGCMTVLGVNGPMSITDVAKRIDAHLLGGRLLELYGHEVLPKDVPAPGSDAYGWLGDEPMLAIAHGLGPQLLAGANTKRAFDEARGQGFRIFEMDLAVTSDGRLICYHGDARPDSLAQLTWPRYQQLMAENGVEPLDFAEVVEWARRDPHIYFVLDVKNRFDDAYRMIRAAIGSPSLGRAFIPQIYFFSELPQFRNRRFFAGEIFTGYRTRLTVPAILRTAKRLHIEVVALTRDQVASLKTIPPGITVLTYPIEDAYEAARLREKGIRGIYTSYLSPHHTPEIYAPWPDNCIPGRRWRMCDFPKPVIGASHPQQ